MILKVTYELHGTERNWTFPDVADWKIYPEERMLYIRPVGEVNPTKVIPLKRVLIIEEKDEEE